jgi:hypothetical protein
MQTLDSPFLPYSISQAWICSGQWSSTRTKMSMGNGRKDIMIIRLKGKRVRELRPKLALHSRPFSDLSLDVTSIDKLDITIRSSPRGVNDCCACQFNSRSISICFHIQPLHSLIPHSTLPSLSWRL